MDTDAIYTAIFGRNGDKLHKVEVPYGCKCLAFGEYSAPAEHETGWTLMPQLWGHADPRLRARRHKLLSHQLLPEAEYTLWVDGCYTPICDPSVLVREYLQYTDICVFEHQQRNCIYDEAQACIQLRKDREDVIRSVAARYRAEGYPANNGLAETTAVLRRHTPAVKKFNELWWQELSNNSIRDQLSFNYVAWKLGVPYNTFEGTRTHNPYFAWRAH